MLRPKKVVLFPEIGRMKNYSLARIVKCVSEYMFLISKKQTKKEKKYKNTKKEKEIKEKREYLRKIDQKKLRPPG